MKEDHFSVWLKAVLVQSDKAKRKITPKILHDLRVAIRRCRSIASGYQAVNSNPLWEEINRTGKTLFKSLASLRDVHVMKSWVLTLAPPADPLRRHLLRALNQRIRSEYDKAQLAIFDFDQKRWQTWHERLPDELKRISISETSRMELTAKRWNKAYALHRQAIRGTNHERYHELRIALKRFRYTVESFLPREYTRWEDKLKMLQDILGEIHDLDVLREEIEKESAHLDTKIKRRWFQRLEKEQALRFKRYRQLTKGRNSLWIKWRAEIDVIPS